MQKKLKLCKCCDLPKLIWKKGMCKYCSQLNEKEKYKLRKVSTKQQGRLQQYMKLRNEYLDKHQLCELHLEGCTLRSTEIHHTKNRIGDNLFEGFVSTCRACHNKQHF